MTTFLIPSASKARVNASPVTIATSWAPSVSDVRKLLVNRNSKMLNVKCYKGVLAAYMANKDTYSAQSYNIRPTVHYNI